jgi:hypothetical protein
MGRPKRLHQCLDACSITCYGANIGERLALPEPCAVAQLSFSTDHDRQCSTRSRHAILAASQRIPARRGLRVLRAHLETAHHNLGRLLHRAAPLPKAPKLVRCVSLAETSLVRDDVRSVHDGALGEAVTRQVPLFCASRTGHKLTLTSRRSSLVVLVMTTLLVLLSTGLVVYFPVHLSFLLSRAMYYLSGTEMSPADAALSSGAALGDRTSGLAALGDYSEAAYDYAYAGVAGGIEKLVATWKLLNSTGAAGAEL